ncbi:MAG TPA: PEP-CTERM sorting domain-containing protein [Pirellulales bacterium]|jgi:hypothetical protein|nr:PEP-CTERM sorting domain-containing protein [Pirellulales bacterium]
MKSISLRVALLLACIATISLAAAPARAAEIFVGSTPTAIGEYSDSGAAINSSLITGLSDAIFGGHFLAASANDLFVVNSPSFQDIGEYTTSGATVNASFVDFYAGFNPTLEGSATSIAVAGDVLLVAGDIGTDLFSLPFDGIAEINMSGTVIDTISLPSNPLDIVVSGGDIFVDFGPTIGEWTTSGAVVNASLITGLGVTVASIAVSGSDIFITNTPYGLQPPTGDYISEYTTSGALVNASLISGLYSPNEVAVYGGNLFVSSMMPELPYGDVIGEYTLSGDAVNASLITFPSIDNTSFEGNPDAFVIVPEPATWLLALMGLASLLLVGRRR